MMKAKKAISPPLPLPIGFALLPSLLPGRNLTPCLYADLNGLPICLTLSPSHEPHLSFLPLLLALDLPDISSPLALLQRLQLDKSHYSIDIDGSAPWVDIWLPLSLARVIVRELGAHRLFWDAAGRGLLGNVDEAVSWEEGNGWCHNWLPSKSHIPPSSYCLQTLLSTEWPGIELIPEDRCINTACDKGVHARLVSKGQHDDPSKLRAGHWGRSWDILLRWSSRAWEEYTLYPSKPPSSSPRPGPKSNGDTNRPLDLLPLLPTLIYQHTLPPQLTLSPSDLTSFLPPHHHSILSIIYLLCRALLAFITSFLPVLPGQGYPTRHQLEEKRWRARVNLALADLVGAVVVSAWKAGRERDRLRAIALANRQTIPADIVLSSREAELLPNGGESVVIERSVESPAKAGSPSRGLEGTPDRTLEELERKRGGSPDPALNSRKAGKHREEVDDTPDKRTQSSQRRRSINPEAPRHSPQPEPSIYRTLPPHQHRAPSLPHVHRETRLSPALSRRKRDSRASEGSSPSVAASSSEEEEEEDEGEFDWDSISGSDGDGGGSGSHTSPGTGRPPEVGTGTKGDRAMPGKQNTESSIHLRRPHVSAPPGADKSSLELERTDHEPEPTGPVPVTPHEAPNSSSAQEPIKENEVDIDIKGDQSDEVTQKPDKDNAAKAKAKKSEPGSSSSSSSNSSSRWLKKLQRFIKILTITISWMLLLAVVIAILAVIWARKREAAMAARKVPVPVRVGWAEGARRKLTEGVGWKW